MWGALPGYWKQLNSVPAGEIIYHLNVWSFLVSALLVFSAGRWHLVAEILKNRKRRFLIYFTSGTIALNWLTYVYAINAGMIVEASLGYYINPLVNIFLGMVFLKERFSRLQTCALMLAVCGVAYITLTQGSVPWIALTLAFSFGLYGLFKKIGNLDSVTSLTVETMLLSLFAIPAVVYLGLSGGGGFGGGSLYTDVLLADQELFQQSLYICSPAERKLSPFQE
jgi:chloramphenicol-sensitive protein RarD